MFQYDFELEAGLDYRPIEGSGIEMRPETREYIENGHQLDEAVREEWQSQSRHAKRYEKAKFALKNARENKPIRIESKRFDQFLPEPVDQQPILIEEAEERQEALAKLKKIDKDIENQRQAWMSKVIQCSLQISALCLICPKSRKITNKAVCRILAFMT